MQDEDEPNFNAKIWEKEHTGRGWTRGVFFGIIPLVCIVIFSACSGEVKPYDRAEPALPGPGAAERVPAYPPAQAPPGRCGQQNIKGIGHAVPGGSDHRGAFDVLRGGLYQHGHHSRGQEAGLSGRHRHVSHLHHVLYRRQRGGAALSHTGQRREPGVGEL